jgi:hypothetical protein
MGRSNRAQIEKMSNFGVNGLIEQEITQVDSGSNFDKFLPMVHRANSAARVGGVELHGEHRVILCKGAVLARTPSRLKNVKF